MRFSEVYKATCDSLLFKVLPIRTSKHYAPAAWSAELSGARSAGAGGAIAPGVTGKVASLGWAPDADGPRGPLVHSGCGGVVLKSWQNTEGGLSHFPSVRDF